MSEPREQGKRDAAGESGIQQDLSVPMWVWTLLGFVAVVAVIIVVIIWGGAQSAHQNEGATEPSETMSTTEPAEPETMPATAPAPEATPPG